MHVYVDGALTTITNAAASRSDVGSAYPAYGALHGYDTTIAGLSTGSHTVCSYGVDSGSDGNALLACKTLTI